MPALRYRFNYANRTLEPGPNSAQVAVYLKDGGTRYQRWLGFIDLADAKQIHNAIAVKLIVEEYSNDEIGRDWIKIPEGHVIQGCLTPEGVYAVTETNVRMVSTSTDKK